MKRWRKLGDSQEEDELFKGLSAVREKLRSLIKKQAERIRDLEAELAKRSTEGTGK